MCNLYSQTKGQAAIVALTIPLALLATFIGLTWVGIPANLLSLGAMDFGIIVDGAVIVVENVFRKLSEASHGHKVLAIDGIVLWDFDYIDLGRVRMPSFTVPVTIKSLMFTEDPRRPRAHRDIDAVSHDVELAVFHDQLDPDLRIALDEQCRQLSRPRPEVEHRAGIDAVEQLGRPARAAAVVVLRDGVEREALRISQRRQAGRLGSPSTSRVRSQGAGSGSCPRRSA